MFKSCKILHVFLSLNWIYSQCMLVIFQGTAFRPIWSCMAPVAVRCGEVWRCWIRAVIAKVPWLLVGVPVRGRESRVDESWEISSDTELWYERLQKLFYGCSELLLLCSVPTLLPSMFGCSSDPLFPAGVGFLTEHSGKQRRILSLTGSDMLAWAWELDLLLPGKQRGRIGLPFIPART